MNKHHEWVWEALIVSHITKIILEDLRWYDPQLQDAPIHTILEAVDATAERVKKWIESPNDIETYNLPEVLYGSYNVVTGIKALCRGEIRDKGDDFNIDTVLTYAKEFAVEVLQETPRVKGNEQE